MNLYHILYKTPVVDLMFMKDQKEKLVRQLYYSGKIRIDTDTRRNFVIFVDPCIKNTLVFSKMELNHKDLIDRTKGKIKKLYLPKYRSNIDDKVEEIFDLIVNKSNKHIDVPKDTTLKLIRLLVHSAHPIVVKWLIYDGVEIFISYSNDIGDVMDIQTWQTCGQNSGMQSTDGKNVAIFISCGGDPFLPNNTTNATYGDGWAALARLQIIAGQEIGHYADIKRDDHGRQIGRHSANFQCTIPMPNVQVGRKNDILKCNEILSLYSKHGSKNLINQEKVLKILRDKNVSIFKRIVRTMIYHIYRTIFFYFLSRHNIKFLHLYKNEKYIASMLEAMCYDMIFNLAPKAQVYKSDDKLEEEAIACAEALARVPQQVMKWGHLATQTLMPNLYFIYYKQVISSLIKQYTKLTGQTFVRESKKYYISNVVKRWWMKIRYKKTEFSTVRDLE